MIKSPSEFLVQQPLGVVFILMVEASGLYPKLQTYVPGRKKKSKGKDNSLLANISLFIRKVITFSKHLPIAIGQN